MKISASYFLITLMAINPALHAGTFVTGIALGQEETATNHPYLYVGQEGTLEVRICLDPEVTDATLRDSAVRQIVSRWNAMAPQSSNLTADVPAGKSDFESALLHEIGHCAFGLGHPNFDLSANLIEGFLTKANSGDDGVFTVGFGSDGVPGSIDDQRGDDVNRHLFFTFDNYPYLLLGPVDKTTYSRNLDDLPPGSSFAANANRLSGPVAMPPVHATEAVMNSYQLPQEGRRTLQHDDVATIRYAMSGLDELEGAGNDDYTVELIYQGRTTKNCEVIIEDLAPGSTFGGICVVEAIAIAGAIQHFRLAGTGRVQMSVDLDWYFAAEVFSAGFENGDFDGWSSVFP